METTAQVEMSLAQAAHTLGLRWAAAYDLLLSRKLEGRKVGPRWFVTTESVQRRLNDGEP